MFGPAERFPFAPDRTYTPPDSGYEELIRLHDRLGLSRAVLAQASCHGTDNSAMIDALRRGRGRFAGVAMLDDTHTDEDLAGMHEVGVRGIRFNFVRHLRSSVDAGSIRQLTRRLAPLGWHVELHLDAEGLNEHRHLFSELEIPFIIDHMGRVRADRGVDEPPFSLLLDLVRTNELAWVKISGAERISVRGGPSYEDVVPLARALVEAAPDRILWGTDWPHPNVHHMPDDGDLVDLLADYVPDEDTRNRILVDNPEVLYDFTS